MTSRLYYTTHELSGTARITRIVPETRQVYLDRTLFAPQGGGQPSDTGVIGNVSVVCVSYTNDDDIAHAVTSTEGMNVGDVVSMNVDRVPRELHSRYHTAGHLLAGVAERLLPRLKAKGGHHWPGEARVEFLCDVEPSQGFISALNAELIDAIETDAPISATNGVPPPRLVTIQSFQPLPCGGTHVRSLRELGAVTVRGVKLKKGILRVGYDVLGNADMEPSALAT